jgi:hypothetical protein
MGADMTVEDVSEFTAPDAPVAEDEEPDNEDE